MKKAKHVLSAIIATSVVFGSVYLIGAFAAADFDIRNWSDTLRQSVGLGGGIMGIIAGFCFYSWYRLTDYNTKN